MFSILASQYTAAVAFVQSLIQERPRKAGRQPAGSQRSANAAGRESMARRVPAKGEHVSDFDGEAPLALVQAYRDGAHADEPDNARRRSFVI